MVSPALLCAIAAAMLCASLLPSMETEMVLPDKRHLVRRGLLFVTTTLFLILLGSVFQGNVMLGYALRSDFK